MVLVAAILKRDTSKKISIFFSSKKNSKPKTYKVCKTLKQVAEFLDIQRVTDSKRTKHSDA